MTFQVWPFVHFRFRAEQLSNVPKTCEVTFKGKAIEAMHNPLVNWSPYSIEFASAFGIFIICLGGLLLVLIGLIVECCLGAYRQVLKLYKHVVYFQILNLFWSEASRNIIYWVYQGNMKLELLNLNIRESLNKVEEKFQAPSTVMIVTYKEPEYNKSGAKKSIALKGNKFSTIAWFNKSISLILSTVEDEEWFYLPSTTILATQKKRKENANKDSNEHNFTHLEIKQRTVLDLTSFIFGDILIN